MFGSRTDKFDSNGFADFSKVGILREESVAGMNGVRSSDLGCAQNIGDIPVAESGVSRSDTDLLVGGTYMKVTPCGSGWFRLPRMVAVSSRQSLCRKR